MENKPKKTKRRSRVWIVLLIVLFLLALAAGFLYYSVCKAPIELDDPQQMAACAPMSPEERFDFSPTEQLVQMKVDASDIWSLVIAYAGPDFMDDINEELSSYSLSVLGCGIHMDQEGLRLDLELSYQDIRLVARIPCALEINGRQISLRPTGVKLGVIPLPVGKFLSNLELEFELEIPVIADVKQISFAQDTLLISGSMEADIRSLVPMSDELGYIGILFAEYQSVVDILHDQDGYCELLSWLEQDPGSVVEIYQKLFELAEPKVTAEYLNSSYGLTERFLPGIDCSGTSEKHAFILEQLPPLEEILQNFMNALERDFTNWKIRLVDGEFLCSGSAFQAVQYSDGRYDDLFTLLDPDSFFLVLVDAENGHTRRTLPLSYITDSDQKFTQAVDFEKIYIIGCVFRRTSGAPVLVYRAEELEGEDYFRFVDIVPLTEEEAAQLQVPGEIGVWIG